MTRPHQRAVRLDPTDEHGGPWSVRFAFDAAMNAHIKGVIDKTERWYDPKTRTWYVESWQLDALADAFCEAGYRVLVDGEQRCPAA